jgi:RAB protein geranylgeranyltransferase component A
MRAVFKKFGLDEEPCEFIGHAMALYHNDEFVFFVLSCDPLQIFG